MVSLDPRTYIISIFHQNQEPLRIKIYEFIRYHILFLRSGSVLTRRIRLFSISVLLQIRFPDPEVNDLGIRTVLKYMFLTKLQTSFNKCCPILRHSGIWGAADEAVLNTQTVGGDMPLFLIYLFFRFIIQYEDMSRRITLFGLLTWTGCFLK